MIYAIRDDLTGEYDDDGDDDEGGRQYTLSVKMFFDDILNIDDDCIRF